MVRIFIFVLSLGLSSSVLATPAELVGKWRTGCVEVAPGWHEYQQVSAEYRADGTYNFSVDSYSSNSCTGPQLSHRLQSQTYSADDFEIHEFSTESGHSSEYISSYSIVGDVMTVTMHTKLIDGVKQNRGTITVVWYRVP